MTRKKNTLTRILLIPLLAVVLLQGVLTFAVMMISDVRGTIESSIIDNDSKMVENRCVLIEDSMVNSWSSIRFECTNINRFLEEYLNQKERTIQDFLADRTLQNEYVMTVFPEMLDVLRTDMTSGCFLILSNVFAEEEDHEYVGFFLRDSDPMTKSGTTSDLLMERGSKNIARKEGIALDSSWSPSFTFKKAGERDADRFFYEPLTAARENPDADMQDLGYWSLPFVLEDHQLDNHGMITYSVPLIYRGVVYGVIGSEISVTYLKKNYLMIQSGESDRDTGLMLAVDTGEGTYEEILGKGILCDTVCRNDQYFCLEQTSKAGLYQVTDKKLGTQRIYAVTSALNISKNNSPYENQNWVLCGLNTEKSIYSVGGRLYRSIVAILLICGVIAMIVLIVVVRRISNPVNRLVDSVRGGIMGLKNFGDSEVAEVDDLYKVIRTLTEKEIAAVSELRDEKDHYRIALESSSDIFFTYYEKEHVLEIVNSEQNDGRWQLDENGKAHLNTLFMDEDVDVIKEIINKQHTVAEEEVELRMKDIHGDGYRWVIMRYWLRSEQDSQAEGVIGYIRDNHERKLEELAKAEEAVNDPTTGLYLLPRGMERIREHKEEGKDGLFIDIDIADFRRWNSMNGMNYGDLLLNLFGSCLWGICIDTGCKYVFMRAGSDEFLLWISGNVAFGEQVLKKLQHDIDISTRHASSAYTFYAGIRCTPAKESIQEMAYCAHEAMQEAMRQGRQYMLWVDEEAQVSEEAAESSVGGVAVEAVESSVSGVAGETAESSVGGVAVEAVESSVSGEAGKSGECSDSGVTGIATMTGSKHEVKRIDYGAIISRGFSRKMGIAAFIMNLFDKSRHIEDALDLTACLLYQEYGLRNLMISLYQSDFCATTLEYLWKPVTGIEEKRTLVRHSQIEYEELFSLAQKPALNLITEEWYRKMPIGTKETQAFLNKYDGYFFPMSDYSGYSGGIHFIGFDQQKLSDEGIRKELHEICTIIQNRYNQEHRDKSAQARADFLANMSHEIRTPMNGIIGMVEIALKEGQSQERQIDCLHKVKDSSQYLLGLLNDILDMSKIESGKMKLLISAFNLNKMLDNLHTVLDVKFDEKLQHYETDIQLIHHWFNGDALRINQVLINLLGNAIKYSPEKATIRLVVREYEVVNGGSISELYFAVTDNGIGVSEEDRMRIFRSFEQVDGAAIHQQGTGLGLAISNRLIRMMGSSIELESVKGEGSTFSFSLHLPIVEEKEEVQETTENEDAGGFSGKRILIVEDNELNMEILEAILEDMELLVEEAHNGQEAVDMFCASEPGTYQMIIMDIMMPVMNGLEATNTIRRSDHPDAVTIPIIAMSANAFDEDVKLSLASGMNDHLAKPIEMGKLIKALERFL